jgi:hypothetical protein
LQSSEVDLNEIFEREHLFADRAAKDRVAFFERAENRFAGSFFTALSKSAADLIPPVWFKARVGLAPIFETRTSMTFSTTSIGVGQRVARRSMTRER